MIMKSLFGVFAAALIVAGCGGGEPTTTSGLPATAPLSGIPGSPGSHVGQSIGINGQSAGIKLVGNVKPDKSCPTGFIYCVTISKKKSATLYYCYSTASYCGPSQYQYTWADAFYFYPDGYPVTYFSGFFNPNPGDPTYDRISLNVPLKSTHGKIRYQQEVCPLNPIETGCMFGSVTYVGIRIK